MKFIVIGDSHLKISILEDAKNFISKLLEIIVCQSPKDKYDAVVLLGDQADTFAVVRSEILSLWTTFFIEASKHTKIIALVGNHDISGVDGGTNFMEPFKAYPNVHIVDQIDLIDGIFYFPFIRDTQEFERLVDELPTNSFLICHQSFNGAQFENGFYDPSGADPKCVAKLKHVISGHIHKEQTLGNIWYPGTPFAHSFSDAGEDKYIYELDIHDGTYAVAKAIKLNMPEYMVIKKDTIKDLEEEISHLAIHSNVSYKFIATGTPSEIAAFWQSDIAKAYKNNAKRVVDAFVSIKPEQNLPGSTGKTQKEKLNEFISSKTWRTPKEQLIIRAERLLTK